MRPPQMPPTRTVPLHHVTENHDAHAGPPADARDPGRWVTTMLIAAASGVVGGLLLFIVGWFYGALAANQTPTTPGHGAEILALAALFSSVGALAAGVMGGVTHRFARRRPAAPHQQGQVPW